MILFIYQRRNYNGKQAGTDVVWEGRFIREEPIVPKEALEHWGEEIFQEEIKVDTDFIKSEMAQFLQLDNLNFLIGAGCSSHIVDDKELGIPGMASLYSVFFKTYPDFDIAGQMAQPIFNGNLEKMLETMGAISVANRVSTIDGDIENKICVCRGYESVKKYMGESSQFLQFI